MILYSKREWGARVKLANIRRVVEAARASFCFKPDMVISIETTPIIADREPEKIRAFKEMGIERISMGVQTTHFKLAHSLGCEYEGLTMLESAVRNIRDAGFRLFNIDLMYGFAGQSPETWRTTVEQTIGLGPEYTTLYQMRYKGTRIQGQAAHVTRQVVNELEGIARDMLLTAGYAGTPGKNTYSKVPGDVGTEDHFPREVAFVLQHGLMEVAGPYLRLTPRGAGHFNGVVALFYAGAVKDYLIYLS